MGKSNFEDLVCTLIIGSAFQFKCVDPRAKWKCILPRFNNIKRQILAKHFTGQYLYIPKLVRHIFII